jgi:hypothetical protein
MKKIILLSLFVLFLLSTNAKAITYTYHPYGSAVKCGLYKSSYLTGETMTINCIYEHDCYKPILAFPMHMYGTVNGVSKLVLDGPSFYLTDGCQYWYHSTLSNFVAPSVPGNYSVSIPFGYATLYLPYTVTASTPPPSTSGYNCNSSTGTCSYVSSGASYSSLSTCNANCSAPTPDTSGYKCNSSTGSCYYVSSGATYSSSSTCNANCSAPSGYSCGLDGTCSYCSDSSISGCDNVSLASCNSGCSCTNDSCDNLNMNNYCSGDYVCTGRCKGNRYGSYSCTPAERCVGMTYTCSASGVYQTRGSYEQVVCSSGACPFTAYSWLDYSMCGDDDPCRVETCGDSCEYNYCSDDTTIKRKTVGTDYDCYSGVSGGCLNEESTSCPPETTPETCEVGYVCREVPGTQSCRSMPNVDCVPKSSSWSEV